MRRILCCLLGGFANSVTMGCGVPDPVEAEADSRFGSSIGEILANRGGFHGIFLARFNLCLFYAF